MWLKSYPINFFQFAKAVKQVKKKCIYNWIMQVFCNFRSFENFCMVRYDDPWFSIKIDLTVTIEEPKVTVVLLVSLSLRKITLLREISAIHANYLSLLIVKSWCEAGRIVWLRDSGQNVRIDIRGNRRNGRFLLRENKSSAWSLRLTLIDRTPRKSLQKL